MKKHSLTITIEKDEGSNKIHAALAFDPPATTGSDSNELTDYAAGFFRMVQDMANGDVRVTAIDGATVPN